MIVFNTFRLEDWGRKFMKKILLLITIISLIIAVIIIIDFLSIRIPSSRDADKANGIYNFVIDKCISNRVERNIKCYWSLGNSIIIISVYGIKSEEEMKFVVNKLKSEKIKRGWEAIKLSYFDSENWITSGSSSCRGEEKLLYSYTIE